jgi:hypothetical protein
MVHELLQKLTRLFGRQSLDMVRMRSYIEIHAARCFMLLDEVMFAHLERGWVNVFEKLRSSDLAQVV